MLSLILILCFFLNGRTNAITPAFSITDPGSIVSSGKNFTLGFFSPGNTNNRYLGIYYTFSETTVVWVANRETPLTDSSGTLSISGDGNLVLTNRLNQSLWSTNATTSPTTTTVELLDAGNLILRDNSTGNVIWDTSTYPTNCLVPGPILEDKRTRITSWKSPSDPSIGNFTAGVDGPGRSPQIITWENGRRYYRTGPWNGVVLIGVPDMYAAPLAELQVKNTSRKVTYTDQCNYLHNMYNLFNLNSTGTLMSAFWSDQNNRWNNKWDGPKNECDLYANCGSNGVCNSLNSPICCCLIGYEPANPDEWRSGNWTNGCVRPTKCEGENPDRFLELKNMKVPDLAVQVKGGTEEECRSLCIGNCSCLAYSFDAFIGCMSWGESLVDTQQLNGVGAVMYVRVPYSNSKLDNNGGKSVIIIVAPIVAGVVFTSVCIFIAWWCMAKRRGNKVGEQKTVETLEPAGSKALVLEDESEKAGDFKVLPVFTFKTLADATNQFHDGNMIGRGGFGYVYKGKLEDGEVIAVKRLSANSGQGGEEFKNEAVVISKVQHRNLVKVLGCCVEGDEKMLVYEYMPNRSLDLCVFDPTHPSQKILDWKKRFSIVEGIVRGLLYLHRDSRLKIVHRDLKPSNVLLDEDWNPKISDFGMARIFGGNQDQDNTTRVVGTYGYMAPEYAVEGLFSEKSDVYSFGILVLEIVSGKKNTDYYNEEWPLSLLGCAWKLWNEGNGMALADQVMADVDSEAETVRCIHIALLCTQESPGDRPAFQTVMSMLSGEIVDLPLPEQPVFEENWNRINPTSQCKFSINKLSMTAPYGR